MRWIKLIIPMLFITLALSMFFPIEVFGVGMETERMSEEEMSTAFEKLGLQLIDNPKTNNRFSYFDVNEEGNYMLGFNGGKDLILVFDRDNDYLYGFSMVSNGAFGLEWDGENIVIYCDRSDLAVTIDKNGNCLRMEKILNTTENNRYWNNLRANKKTIGGFTYVAEHELGSVNIFGGSWGTYARFVRISFDGQETVLFDGASVDMSILLICIVVFGGLLIVACSIYLFHLRGKKSYQR